MPTRLLQFGSVQGPGVPTQTPSWHVSVVQAAPSLHGAVLLVWRQPPAPSQVSSVQGLLSSQFWVVVAVHVPPWHVSPIVQGLASSQGAVLFTWMQPLTGSQPSSVQGLPSSQVGAAAPTQAPSWQVSLAVQALASSQGAVLLMCRQPPAASQASSVQALPSSQGATLGTLAQTPAVQLSSVQGLPSSQSA